MLQLAPQSDSSGEAPRGARRDGWRIVALVMGAMLIGVYF